MLPFVVARRPRRRHGRRLALHELQERGRGEEDRRDEEGDGVGRRPHRRRVRADAPRANPNEPIMKRTAVAALRRRRSSTSERARRPAGAASPCSRAAPAGEHPEGGLGADDRLVRRRQLHRVQDEGPRLRAAHAAVEGDQLLERAALVELLVVEAVHHDVGDVGEPVRAQQVGRGRGREARQRVLALHAALAQVVGAARAERHGAVLGGPHQQPAHVRVRAQRREQVGVPRVDLLQRQPAAARPSGRSARGCPSPSPRPCARRPGACPRPSACGRSPRARPWRRPSRSRRRRPGPRRAGAPAGLQVALHQLVQAVAVALQEGGALRLAVVGEHDDLVGARGVLAGARDAPELLVDLAQHLEGVVALEPGVVGDLVVARRSTRRRPGTPIIMSLGCCRR